MMFQGRHQEAEVSFRRAGDIGDKTYEDLGMLQLSLAQGRYDDAISYSSKLGAASKTAMNYFWLTAAYAGKGDKEKAFETLQQALKLGFWRFHHPGYQPVLQAVPQKIARSETNLAWRRRQISDNLGKYLWRALHTVAPLQMLQRAWRREL
jgi:hypothetical protein